MNLAPQLAEESPLAPLLRTLRRFLFRPPIGSLLLGPPLTGTVNFFNGDRERSGLLHWASGFKSHRGDRERPPFTARRGIIATGHGACNASVDGKMAPSRQSSRPSCTRSDARSIATTFKRFQTRSRPSRTTAYLHRRRRRHLSHPPSRTPLACSQPARHSPLAYLRPCVLSFNSQRRNLPLLLSRLHSPLTVRIFLFGPKPTLFPRVFSLGARLLPD